jgi:hypothetical protein
LNTLELDQPDYEGPFLQTIEEQARIIVSVRILWIKDESFIPDG